MLIRILEKGSTGSSLLLITRNSTMYGGGSLTWYGSQGELTSKESLHVYFFFPFALPISMHKSVF